MSDWKLPDDSAAKRAQAHDIIDEAAPGAPLFVVRVQTQLEAVEDDVDHMQLLCTVTAFMANETREIAVAVLLHLIEAVLKKHGTCSCNTCVRLPVAAAILSGHAPDGLRLNRGIVH